MGHYLKQQYEERDLAKALAKVHGLIDLDYSKLYDKYRDLELSHNRLEKLLKRVLFLIENCQISPIFEFGFDIFDVRLDDARLHDDILRELKNPLYRVRERKKGGKKCV